MKRERIAEIKNIFRIIRDEPFPRFYENTDFSVEAIKTLIKEGESKTNQILERTSLINKI